LRPAGHPFEERRCCSSGTTKFPVIFVIEDHADSLQTLAAVLTRCGARVLTATDTMEARAHLGEVNINLVVADLALPGESGAGFVAWLRQQPREKGGNVTAIAITGFPEQFPAQRVGGFAAYF
jgi:CheY-like chemotaxis protein